MNNKYDYLWLFLGENASHSCAVFESKELAEEWIGKTRTTGVLTAYPLNTSVYDWGIESGYFTPTKSYQKEPQFIGKFTSASQEHYHYDNGKQVT